MMWGCFRRVYRLFLCVFGSVLEMFWGSPIHGYLYAKHEKEVHRPVWAFYNIKKEAGCPSPPWVVGAGCGAVAIRNIVPGARCAKRRRAGWGTAVSFRDGLLRGCKVVHVCGKQFACPTFCLALTATG